MAHRNIRSTMCLLSNVERPYNFHVRLKDDNRKPKSGISAKLSEHHPAMTWHTIPKDDLGGHTDIRRGAGPATLAAVQRVRARLNRSRRRMVHIEGRPSRHAVAAHRTTPEA